MAEEKALITASSAKVAERLRVLIEGSGDFYKNQIRRAGNARQESVQMGLAFGKTGRFQAEIDDAVRIAFRAQLAGQGLIIQSVTGIGRAGEHDQGRKRLGLCLGDGMVHHPVEIGRPAETETAGGGLYGHDTDGETDQEGNRSARQMSGSRRAQKMCGNKCDGCKGKNKQVQNAKGSLSAPGLPHCGSGPVFAYQGKQVPCQSPQGRDFSSTRAAYQERPRPQACS